MKAALYTGLLAPHDATGHAVLRMQEILLSRGVDSLIYCERSAIERPDVRVVRGARGWMDAWRRFRENDLDIFHYGCSYSLFQFMRRVPRHARSAVYFHGVTPRRFLPRRERLSQRYSLHQFRLADRADTVLHATDYSREMARAAGVTRPEFTCLPLPLDLPAVPRPPRDDDDGDDGVFRMIHVGRLVQNKGLLDILAALRRLHAGGFTRWELEVIHSPVNSDPRYQQRVGAFLSASALSGHVKFPGPPDSREHLARRYAAADLTVLATRHETYCLPLLESLACGTPVVAYAAGAVPEVSAGHATLVEPGDIDAFAAAIDRARTASPRFLSDLHGTMEASAFHTACRTLLRDRTPEAFASRLIGCLGL